MSTQNSIIAGIAGAAIASSVWYFSGSTNSENQQASPTNQNAPMTLGAQIPCPQQNAHAILWPEAQTLVERYVNPNNRNQLFTESGAVLKGWYLDKCVIENLFDSYPDADGLQLYVGLDSLPDKTLANTLIWMASQLTKDGQGNIERENCISVPNTIMDDTEFCPISCPQKNDLP
jgi:hypothetical protein